ncbi:hypothetical protein DAERI_030352 [Deinococcus aerius]|uniref:Uncharacterized protein n=1 Tax=Deinococcus aerius TaxID=200253 RepID=A0A2I9D3L7_9DEIO|nr:hypothetical protein DAERI_030352 [Deinococcus aerius]
MTTTLTPPTVTAVWLPSGSSASAPTRTRSTPTASLMGASLAGWEGKGRDALPGGDESENTHGRKPEGTPDAPLSC